MNGHTSAEACPVCGVEGVETGEKYFKTVCEACGLAVHFHFLSFVEYRNASNEKLQISSISGSQNTVTDISTARGTNRRRGRIAPENTCTRLLSNSNCCVFMEMQLVSSSALKKCGGGKAVGWKNISERKERFLLFFHRCVAKLASAEF